MVARTDVPSDGQGTRGRPAARRTAWVLFGVAGLVYLLFVGSAVLR